MNIDFLFHQFGNTPSALGEHLLKQIILLSDEKRNIDEEIRKYEKGKLRIKKRTSHVDPEYYYCPEIEPMKYGRPQYIPKGSFLAHNVAQREYLEKKSAELATIINITEELAGLLQNFDRDSAYNSLPDRIKELVDSLTPPEDDFIEFWRKANSRELSQRPVSGNIRTEKGEAVRSKSEKIIADKFYMEGIPYIYEPVIHINSGKTSVKSFTPDFLVLNVRTKKTYYFEHFGMLDNIKYAERTIEKINEYSRNGLRFGQNFLYTMESMNIPIDEDVLETIIYEYLK